MDEDFGTVRVTRVVTAIAAGRILNPKTARSQIMGGIVWGIGSALLEESMLDHHFGRFMNHNLAEYHVPVNADVHDIEVIFVEEQDSVVNPLGAKGLGEIGIVGVAAAIANAVYTQPASAFAACPLLRINCWNEPHPFRSSEHHDDAFQPGEPTVDREDFLRRLHHRLQRYRDMPSACRFTNAIGWLGFFRQLFANHRNDPRQKARIRLSDHLE